MAEVWYRFTDIDYITMAKADKWGMKKTAEMLTWVTIEEDPMFENFTTAVKFQAFDNADRDFKDQLSGAFYRIMQLYLFSLYRGYVWEKESPDYLRELACQPDEIDRLTNISIPQGESLKAIERTVSGLSDKLWKYLSGEIRVGRDDSLKKHIYEEYASDEIKAAVDSKKSMSKREMAQELASGRNAIPKSKVVEYVTSLLDDGCTCWHKVMRDRVMGYFKEVEKDSNDIPDNEKVSMKLTKAVVAGLLKKLYRDRGQEDLVFDLNKHGGQKNSCAKHP